MRHMGLSVRLCAIASLCFFLFVFYVCVVKRGNWISDGFSVAIFSFFFFVFMSSFQCSLISLYHCIYHILGLVIPLKWTISIGIFLSSSFFHRRCSKWTDDRYEWKFMAITTSFLAFNFYHVYLTFKIWETSTFQRLWMEFVLLLLFFALLVSCFRDWQFRWF